MSDNFPPELTHLDEAGQAHMVDVSDRAITVRKAKASGKVILSTQVLTLLRDGLTPKGDVLAAARIAAIMGAKATPGIIPLCHPIALHGVEVEFLITGDGVEISVETKTADRTGVEMEALTAVSVAALTIVDMVKAIDPMAVITDIWLQSKSGGKNGNWQRMQP